MYSPSGSKGVQLKRIWAYGGGGLVVVLVVCRLVYTEALRPLCAPDRCRWVNHVTRIGQSFWISPSFSLVATHGRIQGWKWASVNVIDFPAFSAQFLNIGSVYYRVSLTAESTPARIDVCSSETIPHRCEVLYEHKNRLRSYTLSPERIYDFMCTYFRFQLFCYNTRLTWAVFWPMVDGRKTPPDFVIIRITTEKIACCCTVHTNMSEV